MSKSAGGSPEALRFRQNEALRAQERHVVASLEALPVERWKDESGRRRSMNECCLCLEEYGDEELFIQFL